MCFYLCADEKELHYIGEDYSFGRLADVAVKGVDCARHYHMETVQNKRKILFWGNFLIVNGFNGRKYGHA